MTPYSCVRFLVLVQGLEGVEGEAAEANGGAENGRGGALDIVLDDLGDVDADELVALGSIGTEEVAELGEEEGDFGLGLSVAQPRLVGGEDPLAELAFGGRRSEGASSSNNSGIRGGKGQGVVEEIGEEDIHSLSSLSRSHAVSQTRANHRWGGARCKHRDDTRTSNELSAHLTSSHVRNRSTNTAQLDANLDNIGHTNRSRVGHGREEHAFCA